MAKSPYTDPLTKKKGRKELRSAVRAFRRPLARELNKQERINKLQSQRTSNYFKNYQKSIGRGAQQVQAAYDQAGSSMGAYAAAAGSQDAALRSQLTANSAQDAALYGGSASPESANLALAGQATRVRSGGDIAGAIAGQGANAFAAAKASKSNAKLGRIEALSALYNERGQISDDKMDLAREVADFRAEKLAEMREGERRYALALKEMRLTKKENAKDRALTASENDQDRAASAANAESEGGGGGGADRKKATKDARIALSSSGINVEKMIKQEGMKGASQALISYLTHEEDVDPSIAKRVVKAYLSRFGGGGGGGGGNGGGNGGGGDGGLIDDAGDWIGG